ncbi:MAG: helix-turn-helix transcriptional regulator [Anaerolineae bacterium]|jgi:PadR family transcriptional regulator PadR
MPGRSRRHGWRGASRRPVRFMEPTLLLLLHRGPAHGYPLIEQLSEYGLADMDSSSVYRMLRDMEEQGWVTSSWEEEETEGPPRRVYHLTALGDEVLALWAQDLHQTRDMIDHLLGAYRRHMEEGEGEHH